MARNESHEMCGTKEIMSNDVDAAFFERLAQLNDKFAAALPQTLGRLSAARDAFDATAPQQELVEGLHATLHTLAGSSATFGFRALGQQARVLEQRLRVLTTFDAVVEREWAAWLAELDIFVGWALRDPKSPYPNDETGV
jgi:HPt (histidine-containing phosphotransfer) domain-containing protein